MVDGGSDHRWLGRKSAPVVITQDSATQAGNGERPHCAAEAEKSIGDSLERPGRRHSELFFDTRRSFERLVHHDPAIDNEPDTARRRALGKGLARLERQRIDGGVDTGGLAGRGRKIKGTGPGLRRNAFGEHALPGKGIITPQCFEKLGEARHGRHSYTSLGKATKGRQRP